MKIQPIVEGYGELSSVPLLLRRLRDECGAFEVDVSSPIRRKRWQLTNEATLRQSVRLARLKPDCGAILVLFDGDRDCPKELAPKLQEWTQAEAGPLPAAVVLAKCEYEAWFLAAVESLRGFRGVLRDAEFGTDPESVRGAKEHLEQLMIGGSSYSPTADQAAFSSRFDLRMAYARSRSFRRFVRAFGLLVEGGGIALGRWPPPHWRG